MSEFAPKHIETQAPLKSPEATIIDFPTIPDNSKRIELDYAYQAALTEDVFQENLAKARADVERAIAQESPLENEYKSKRTIAEMELKENDKRTGDYYDRIYRNRKPAQKAQDEHRLAA